ncbi:MAG: hypothetical protein HOQ05_06250 [Corynebacteriales bacterium]|nr:hypothetical protein [Mycobacteriales bacterium]
MGSWFAGRLPDDWFVEAPTVTVDREEIVVVGRLPPLKDEFPDEATQVAAEAGRIARFREDTRAARLGIARHAHFSYGRAVSWGARIGQSHELFTHQSVPVTTWLGQPERIVLDTLMEAGVATSRSEALAWALRLVSDRTSEWLDELPAVPKVDGLPSGS